MDLLETKNRIAQSLVESIFRRADYQFTRFTPETNSLQVGRDDFSPDFRVTRQPRQGPPREFLIEVKYRPAIEQYLSVETQRGDKSIFLMARHKWPNLYFVFVSERPEPGRSCFQVVNLRAHAAGEPFAAVDLADAKEVWVFLQNVEEHEELLRCIFASLTST